MLNRRMILGAGLGGLALVGTAGVWRVTRSPSTAYIPWKLDGVAPLDDVRLDAFRYAILAPNPHNRQPWLIRLMGKDEAEISCDLDKRLPATDPFDRQITIGFGTFLELARIVAEKRGFEMLTELFPDGAPSPRLNKTPVARLKFVKNQSLVPDPLFAAITQRRSNKQVYDLKRKVAETKLAAMTASGGNYACDPAFIAKARTQILAANHAEMTTSKPYMESVDLMRIGHKQIDRNPDGIALGGAMIEAGYVTGQINREQLSDMSSEAYKIGLAQTSETYGSIPALIWIITPANTREDQIEAGRQYVRANLQAAQLGLSMHPISQSLQEYAEVAKPYEAVHNLLGAAGEDRVQMLARVGYGPDIGPSPRWPVTKHIKA